MRLLVTGASGFVGSALVARALQEGEGRVRAAVRRHDARVPQGAERVQVGALGPDTDWRGAMQEIDVVVHAAARVHVLREAAADPDAEFRRANVVGTLRMARDAHAAGVQRFVFISSIGVHGDHSQRPFRPDDPLAPYSAYTRSKVEAEEQLRQLAHDTGLQLVVVRPPMVIGPAGPGNFGLLLRAVRSGVPLPLRSVRNLRSFVTVRNLADFLLRAALHPQAPGGALLVRDGEDLSTPELLRRVAAALGTSVRLVPAPTSLLRLGAALLGRRELARRLCDSLQVDDSDSRSRLGWQPVETVDAALLAAARAFQGSSP